MTRNGQRMLMLIDDEPAQRRLVAALAQRGGWRTVFAGDPEQAIAMLGTQDGMTLDAILVDHRTTPEEMTAMIGELKHRRPALPILVLTADGSVSLAVQAMRSGATDFLVKPLAPERLLAALDAAVSPHTRGGELRPLTEKMSAPLGFDEIVGSAPKFRAALAIAAKAARTRAPVLIEGEMGVGKEVVAQAIHAASPRSKTTLGVVNLASIPVNLIESELFGHEMGAFTGAFERKIGRLQQADGGTLLLDDIGVMPFEVQARLMRFLETGQVQPIGARAPREADVRIIAASNVDLLASVGTDGFREDLYYRLATVQVAIPPLRERAGDLPPLTRHLLARIAQMPGLREMGITDDALKLLMRYDWPGNVRQLQDALFRAAALSDGDALTRLDFPQIANSVSSVPGIIPVQSPFAGPAGVTLYAGDGHLRPLEEIEADVIRLAIGHYRGRMSEVARRLGIGRSTLYRKLGELGIDNAA